MNKKNLHLLFLVFVFVLSSYAVTVSAETADVPSLFKQTSDSGTTTPLLGNAVCSLFDSQTIASEAHVTSYEQAAGIPLQGNIKITNKSNTPLINVGVFVKVYLKETDPKKLAMSGNTLIEENYIASSINLAPHEEKTIPLSADIPYYAPVGVYEVVPYVVPNNTSTIDALYTSGTLAVEGTHAAFSVNDIFKGFIGLNKDTVVINATPYTSNTITKDATPVLGGKKAVVSAELVNTTTSTKEDVIVTWKLYSNDGGILSKIEESEPKKYTLGAGSKVKVSYTITDTNHASYLLIGEAGSQKVKSLIEVSFVRPENSALNINALSITPFPLTAGKKSMVSLCQSSYNGNMTSAHLSLTLTDSQGNTIASNITDGAVVPNGITETSFDFTPTIAANDVHVNAVLSDALSHTERTLAMDCKNIQCTTKSNSNTRFTVSIVLIGGLLAIILLIIAHAIHKHNEHANTL